MIELGNIRVVYLGEENQKKSAGGTGYDKGQYIRIKLKPSKRRTRFNTILIPWNRVIKVTVFE